MFCHYIVFKLLNRNAHCFSGGRTSTIFRFLMRFLASKSNEIAKFAYSILQYRIP